MFRLKEDATEEDVVSVRKGLLELPNLVPAIQRFEIGEDLVLQSGQTNPYGKNRTICWSAWFLSVEAYESYANHDAHNAFVQDILGPVIEKGSRAAIQYKVDE